MRICYDFHIHSALSPCGQNDMTPNNIVNMALLNNLDAIAITDHNCCKNVKSIIDVAEGQPIIVIPGMEIETKEEIHVVCLFSDIYSVYSMQNIIESKSIKLKNKPNIFGEQLILNEEDDVIGKEERLLLSSIDLSINQILQYTNQFNGVMIPAHIDRPSYSIISNLGMIPNDLEVRTLEISRYADSSEYVDRYNEYNVIQCSDAHELGFIGICENKLEVPNFDINTIIQSLKKGK